MSAEIAACRERFHTVSRHAVQGTFAPERWLLLGAIPGCGSPTLTISVPELGASAQEKTALVKSPQFGYVLTSYRTLTMLDSAR